jgi:hypothetical protein
MKKRSDSLSSIRALIIATTFIVMLLNVTLLVPVSPVFAESEVQTCEKCEGRCGSSSGDQIIAVGLKAIMSNDETREAYTTLMESELAHDTFENYRTDKYRVEMEHSIVIVDITLNGALVFVPAVLIEDGNTVQMLTFGVMEELVGLAVPVHGSHVVCWQVCFSWIFGICVWWVTFCVDVCLVICTAISGLAGAGCVAACGVAFPPAAPYCGYICAGAAMGLCYPTCVNWLG